MKSIKPKNQSTVKPPEEEPEQQSGIEKAYEILGCIPLVGQK